MKYYNYICNINYNYNILEMVKQVITKDGNSIKISYSDGTPSKSLTGSFDKSLTQSDSSRGYYCMEVRGSNGSKITISTDNTESIDGQPVDSSSLNSFFNQVNSFFPDAEVLNEAQISAINDLIASKMPITVEFYATDNQTVFDIGVDMQYSINTEMFINGVKQDYSADFTVSVDPKKILYTSTKYSIKQDDGVTIKYFKQ